MTFVSALVVQAKNTGRFLLKKTQEVPLWHFTGSFELPFLEETPFYTMLLAVQKDLGGPIESVEAFLKTKKIEYFIHAWVDNEEISPETDDEYIWADLLHFPLDVDPSVEMVFTNKMFLNTIIQPTIG